MAKTSTQQAELNTLRSKKTNQAALDAIHAKNKVAEPVDLELAASAPIEHDPELAAQSMVQQAIEMARGLGITIPTWKRSLLAFVASFVVGYGVGYLLGTLLSILMVATFTVTGSLFLMYCIAVLGFLGILYAGCKVGQTVGMYIVTGDIDRDVRRAKNWISGWFGSSTLKVA